MDRDLTEARPHLTLSDRPRFRKIINDNFCVNYVAGKTVCVLVTSKESYPVNCVAGKKDCVYVTGKRDTLVTEMAVKKGCLFVTTKKETVNVLPVNSCPVVDHVHFANGYLQKKGVNPDNGHCQEIKYVTDVSCVDHLSSVKSVTNVPTVIPDLPERDQITPVFWGKCAALGISPKVVTVLREGNTLPFWFRPNLTRSPTIISCYVKCTQEPLPVGDIVSALQQKCSSTGAMVNPPPPHKSSRGGGGGDYFLENTTPEVYFLEISPLLGIRFVSK